jgi:hypothetical protein
MEKSAWEQTIRDPRALARLTEWSSQAASAVIGATTDSSSELALSHGFDVEPPAHIEKPNLALISSNNRSTEAATSLLDVQSFVPEIIGLSPLDALEAMEARFRADSSHGNSLLLQAAMNRITAVANIDPTHRAAVDRAAAILSAPDTQHNPPHTDDIWYTVYEHADFGGRSSFTDMSPGWGYWRQPFFGNVGMNDMISSLAFGESQNEVGGAIVLFEHARYFGRYRVYIPTPGQSTSIHYVGNDFNDIASSALIIRRFARETQPVSLGALVPKSKITDIINATPKVRPAGDPVFTWDMWPTGASGSDWHPNDVNKAMIYINVPIMVHTPWPWPDYYAQARYWIYLYVDGGGSIQGYVAYWGYYVESGTISGDVAAGLRDAIPGTIPQVNGLVTNALALANVGGPYQYVYFLPGRFQLAGDVSDDVTIVAVKR